MNYAAFFAIAKQLCFDDDMKANIIDQYTNGRTARLSQMQPAEYQAMINDLNKKVPRVQRSIGGEIANTMRKKIIALCRSMGMERAVGGEVKADMTAIYTFVARRTKAGKPLNEYTEAELPKLVSQIEQIYKDYIKNGKGHAQPK